MPKVVIVGGGFSGCAAAIVARRAGAEVLLLERTDMLLAGGVRAGRMNYNGKLVGAEEAKALGAGDLFTALESIELHRGNIVDERHGYVYNAALAEPTIRRLVESQGIQLEMEQRVTEVEKEGPEIRAIVTSQGERIIGDVFIDCTGTFGGMAVCIKYGKGCAMCIPYRCPVFGDRVSIATRAGAPELMRIRPDGGIGAVGAAITVYKETLAKDLRAELEEKGAISIPLPQDLIDYRKQQIIGGIRSRSQMEYLNVVDIGIAAKCVGIGYLRLEQLRRIPGFAAAQIEDPLGGGKFNSINKISMTRRNLALQVEGFRNLLCAGEKAGPGTGIAEVIVTGILAGFNAVLIALGQDPLVLPRTIAIGDFIAFTGEAMDSGAGLREGYSLAHGSYFDRLCQLGFYQEDAQPIHHRVQAAGLEGALARKLV